MTNNKETTMTTTTTYADLLGRHTIDIPDHLTAQAEVPVLTGTQRQGDILIVPTTARPDRGWAPVGAGVQVVHGEATGNTHWLHGDPGVRWIRLDEGQVVGVVDVPDGAAAYVVHTDEHGANGIGPGTYELRRKRQQADEIQLVAD